MNYGVWDIETKGIGGDFVLAGWFDGVNYEDGKLSDFLRFVKRSPVKVWFAHYGGKYDNLYLMDFLRTNEINFSVKAINSFILPEVSGIKFYDSFLICRQALFWLTRDFGVKHLKAEYSDYEEHRDQKKLKEYLKNDVLGLFEVLTEFKKILHDFVRYNVDFSKKYTLPSIAFDILNNFYNVKDFTQNFLSQQQEDELRQAYYGGRTEVFKRKGERLNYYDFNSLYPYVMAKYSYPIGRFMEVSGMQAHNLYAKGVMGVVKARVTVPETLLIPPLPYRNKKGKLLFPVGTWRGMFATVELKNAEKYGVKVEVEKGFFWSSSKAIFHDFITDLYQLKAKSKGSKRAVAKMLLNSAYGKFGQRREKTSVMTEAEVIRRELPFWKKDYLFSKGFYVFKSSNYSNRLINPLYALYVTAYARIEMMNLIKELKPENVYYCDTDSVLTSSQLSINRISDTKLGLLKKEHFINEGVFIAPKLYAFRENDKVVIKGKGIFKDYLKNIKYNDFLNLLYGGSFEVKEKRFTSFLSGLRLLDKRSKGFVSTNNMTRIIRDNFDKREVLDDKISTKPLIIKE